MPPVRSPSSPKVALVSISTTPGKLRCEIAVDPHPEIDIIVGRVTRQHPLKVFPGLDRLGQGDKIALLQHRHQGLLPARHSLVGEGLGDMLILLFEVSGGTFAELRVPFEHLQLRRNILTARGEEDSPTRDSRER